MLDTGCEQAESSASGSTNDLRQIRSLSAQLGINVRAHSPYKAGNTVSSDVVPSAGQLDASIRTICEKGRVFHQINVHQADSAICVDLEEKLGDAGIYNVSVARSGS